MKIATLGLDIQAGKQKYTCGEFESLVKKYSPKKVAPYTVEFIGEDFDKAEAVVYNAEKKLDLVVVDLDKIETRLGRSGDENEKAVLAKAQKLLEGETLLCDSQFSPQEQNILKTQQLVTYKPCLGINDASDINNIIEKLIAKAGVLLFYTAGEKEVHAWDIKKGDTILTAAGKIHTDLARGFIKGEVVSGLDLDKFFNMAEARSKGLVKTVDRDYLMQEADIIEIKFNV